MYGVIDIGSNSIRLSVFQVEEGGGLTPLFQRKEMTGLAACVNEKGNLTRQGVRRAAGTLERFRWALEKILVEETFVFATASLRNVGNTKEVVQELFAFAWEHQADLWSSASPTGWLYRALRYKVLELLKEDRFWRKHLIRAAGEMPASPEDDFQQRAEITSILTPEEYEILRKLYLEKYTYDELAREMGLKKSALAMRVKRSKERFVKQWNRH